MVRGFFMPLDLDCQVQPSSLERPCATPIITGAALLEIREIKNGGKNIVPDNRKRSRQRAITTDWSHWRRAYISGDDHITIPHLSRQPNAPTESALEKRCQRENWVQLRTDFRREMSAKMLELDRDVKLEVRKRHARLGRAMQALAARGMTHIKPEELGELGVSRLARAGAELERKALGLEEVTVSVKTPADLKRLTDAELLELAQAEALEPDPEGDGSS